MTIVYKLTRKNFTTRNGMLWVDGEEHTAPGNGKMCSKAYIHAYRSPLLAAFFAPIHNIDDYSILWECDADIDREDVDKLGCTRVKTLWQVPLPTLTAEQRIRIAIRCAKLVCSDATWHAWADKWLSGENRSVEMARSAAWDAARAKAAALAKAWAAKDAALEGEAETAWSAKKADVARANAAETAWLVRNAAGWAVWNATWSAWEAVAREEEATQEAARAAWATQEAVRAVRNAVRGGASMADTHRIIEEES